MHIHHSLIPVFYRQRFILCLLCLTLFSAPLIGATQQSAPSPTAAGYSALKLFLEDEELLTLIRRTKMLITFSGISDPSASLIDNIADASELALEELEKLSAEKPAIVFEEFSDETVAFATLDSLRSTTAKEFLLNSKDFEKNLLISQLNVLPVISHLAIELKNKEKSTKRKAWLQKLADQFDNYYQQANALISVSPGRKSLPYKKAGSNYSY